MDYRERISSNPKIMLGKPVIKGSRITVELVLQKLADGYTLAEFPLMYPGITEADVMASIQYAAAIVASEEMIQAA